MTGLTGAVSALTLSLIAPGAGQIFNGQYFKAAVFALLFAFGRTVFLPLLIRIINFKDTVKMLKFIYAFNTVYPAIILLAAADAAYFGRGAHHSVDIIMAILAAFALVSIRKGLRHPFIIYSMSGREDIAKYIIPAKNREK